MELWAHINGNTYPIALGATVNDALGEELDSMDIRIPHVEDFAIKPFDDVYVTDSDAYPTREYGSLYVPDGETTHFYRHFLVSNYQRQEINNEGEGRKRWFNFSISLISETKFLEKVLMPNRTITNPLNRTGKSVFWMASHFIERYTPKVKVKDEGGNSWDYADKIRISTESDKNSYGDYLSGRMLSTVEEEFKDVECQECSFNNPTLREVLTRIFQTRNFIPVVLDGVVFCRSLDYKGSEIDEIIGKTWDTQMMSGEEYVDRLRKNYSQGLTGSNGCVYHEYVGFRNITDPSMTYSGLAVETEHPIYRINKFYICYFSQWRKNTLVKCDMTSFVIPNATRSFLSNDYLNYVRHMPTTVNGYYKPSDHSTYILGACDYRFNTVGYDIGSTRITGWGEEQKYTLDGITFQRKTILENILNLSIFNSQNLASNERVVIRDGELNWLATYHSDFPLGTMEYKIDDITAPEVDDGDAPAWYDIVKTITTMFKTNDDGTALLSNDTLKMKTIFFEIEYQGMVSSAVTVSKRLHDGDIAAIDNQHESMALTENDGLVSQAKVNRLGNKTSIVTARVGYNQSLINIGDHDEDHGICYKRTISLEKDFIAVTYYFCRDYALMNYFTSVNSKYKSSAYASFAQTVSRDETNDVQMLISKDERYVPAQQSGFTFNASAKNVLSFIRNKDSVENDIAFFTLKAPKQGIFEFDEYDDSELEQQYFSTDRAVYLSGNSICMTMGMPDSETAGTYIKQWYPEVKSDTLNIFQKWADLQGITRQEELDLRDVSESYGLYAKNGSPWNDITGTLQDYYSLPSKRYDGSLQNMRFVFSFGNASLDNLYQASQPITREKVLEYYGDNTDDMLGIQYQPKLLPSFANGILSDDTNSVFVRSESYKDAKEKVMQTFQIEPISETDDVIITPWMAKLSDLFNKNIQRVATDSRIPADVYITATDQLTGYTSSFGYKKHSIAIYPSVGDDNLDNFRQLLLKPINKTLYFEYKGAYQPLEAGGKLEMTINRISYIDPDLRFIRIDASFSTGKIKKSPFNAIKIQNSTHEIVLWNEGIIKGNSEIISMMNDPSTNGNYYGQSSSAWNYYDDVFRTPYGGEYEESHFEETPTRLCFAFNFDVFPNGSIITEYESDDETVHDTSVIQNSYFNDMSDPPKSFEVMSSASYMLYDTYVGAAPSNNPDAVVGYGPRQSEAFKIEQYRGDILPKNILWFYSENQPENIRKTYASEQDLVDEGFFPLEDAENAIPSIDETLMTFTYYGAVPIGSMTNPQMRAQYAKMRYMNCFYKDDNGEYHLVISIKKDEQNWPDYVDFANEQIVVKASFYVSFLYDRSKTVYDAGTMRPDYEIDNVAGMISDTPTCHHK